MFLSVVEVTKTQFYGHGLQKPYDSYKNVQKVLKSKDQEVKLYNVLYNYKLYKII